MQSTQRNRLAHQLRAAEDRITDLAGEVAAYREQTEPLSSGAIASIPKFKDGFLRQGGDQRGTPQRSQEEERR